MFECRNNQLVAQLCTGAIPPDGHSIFFFRNLKEISDLVPEDTVQAPAPFC